MRILSSSRENYNEMVLRMLLYLKQHSLCVIKKKTGLINWTNLMKLENVHMHI